MIRPSAGGKQRHGTRVVDLAGWGLIGDIALRCRRERHE